MDRIKHIDKVFHYVISFCLVLGFNLALNIELSILFAFLIGVGKELKDEYDYGGFSLLDLSADILGILTYLAIYKIWIE